MGLKKNQSAFLILIDEVPQQSDFFPSVYHLHLCFLKDVTALYSSWKDG